MLFAALTAVPGAAEGWPEKPVHYIIPFGYGGESGIAARLQEPVFKRLTGQDLVIDHKPGGGGAVVWSKINQMPGDGYTIVGINLPHIIIQPALGARYRTKDIAVVFIFHYTPNALIVAYETLSDLIEDIRARPGEIVFSGSGRGTANHLAQVRFDKIAALKTRYRAFKGTGESIAALLSGAVDAAWGYTTVAMKHKGDVRVLAVAMEHRHPGIPDAPTFRELGIDMVDGAYRGIAVPDSTPEPIRRKISEVFAKLNHDPAYVAKKQALGFVPLDITYDEMPTFMAKRTKEYLDLARRAGLIK